MRRHRQSGFSLVELVAVIMVLSIVGVGLASGFAHLGGSLLLNEDAQGAAQQAQACADHILGSRRNRGFAMTFANCAALGPFNGFGPPTVTNWAPAVPACPAGSACTGYEVTATYGSTGAISRVRFFVVNY